MPGDVQVFYHDTTNGDPFVPLTVLGVTPVLSSGNSTHGYTQFTITFDPTPPGAAAPYNYTGTYSYLIAPDNGTSTTPARCHQLADRELYRSTCRRRGDAPPVSTRMIRMPTARPTRTR